MAERPAHAKTNLVLRVLSRDVTGFHSVETLFCRLDLCDTVHVAEADELSVSVSGPAAEGVPAGPENLCYRAASAFLEAYRQRHRNRSEPVVAIELHKRIPVGSGLGGGSADAAAVLRLLNERVGCPLREAELFRLAGGLGSDVPFALAEVPLALGWGRGGRLLPLTGPPPAPALVVMPPFSVSTAAAYGWLRQARERGVDDRPDPTGVPDGYTSGPPDEGPAAGSWPEASVLSDWRTLAPLTRNVFEPVVAARHPELRVGLAALRGPGTRAALLSGSGAALIAFFETVGDRAAAAERLERAGLIEAGGWTRHETSGPV